MAKKSDVYASERNVYYFGHRSGIFFGFMFSVLMSPLGSWASGMHGPWNMRNESSFPQNIVLHAKEAWPFIDIL